MIPGDKCDPNFLTFVLHLRKTLGKTSIRKLTRPRIEPRALMRGGGGDWDFTTLLTSQVISVAFYREREKSDKFCSEALISAWGSFTCRESMTRDPRLYFPSEGGHTQDFYALKKIHRTRPGFNSRASDPVASMITTGPPGSTWWEATTLLPNHRDGQTEKRSLHDHLFKPTNYHFTSVHTDRRMLISLSFI